MALKKTPLILMFFNVNRRLQVILYSFRFLQANNHFISPFSSPKKPKQNKTYGRREDGFDEVWFGRWFGQVRMLDAHAETDDQGNT